MKLLYSLWKHLTEVVFPQLALEYNWGVYGERDIQLRLAHAVGLKDRPVYPLRNTIPTQKMKELVWLATQVASNPFLFLFL